MHRDKSLNQNLYQNIQNSIPKTDLFHVNPVFTIGGPVCLPKYDGAQQDVLLLQLRVPEVGDSRQRERAAGADRPRARG